MERKTYCDYLRVIATFAVVLLHVSASNWYSTDVNGLQWQAFNFYDSVVRWGVPVFLMISGALFLNREVPLKKIYGKYILRMVIAFYVWSLFYVIMTVETLENGIIYGIKTHMRALALGHYHMWFIIMIIGIYMCIPFYKRIVTDDFIMKYFLILSFIFFFMIPWTIKLLNDYVVGNNEQMAKLVGVVNSYVSNKNMQMVLGYSFYFVLGYFLDMIELKKKQRVIVYILGAIGFAFTVGVDLDLALKTQQPCGNYYGNFDVNIMLEAVCVHTLFKYREYKSEKFNSLIYMISGYTFGAYLIHVFFIEKFSSVLSFNALSFNPVVSVPVVSCAVLVCALLVSGILNHIPIIKKYCV
ncbi:acyltransferase [Lachnobacterium bovis]|uniref:acyltransferase n=1 Tax=Lachnobacterium bovis TaxID=140626 RepID=UPI000486E281|nr:acyltransferase family protein [Lachnobacterium bovis]